VSCNAACDGDATVSASGGTGVYTYSWSTTPSQSTTTATGLCVGSYDVTVTDENSCDTIISVIINEPAALSLSITGIDASCNGGLDGSADLTVNGGTPNYNYLWSNGATSEDITNLATGTYTVTVTDANSCQDSISITINEPTAITLSASVTNANCAQADGSATVVAAGGTGAYVYSWGTTPAQTNATATGLALGTYDVTVYDANGCNETTSATLIDVPGGTASASVVTNTTGFGICDGEATSSMTGGTAPYVYLWNTTPAQTTANATGLCAGTYCVTITDDNGCLDSACVTITEPNAVILTLTPTDILCFGDCTGEIELTVTGGISPYVYSWMPGGMNAEDITNLCAGTYSVTVTDGNGVTAIGAATVNEPAAALNASVVGMDILCNGDATGAVDLSVSGGTTPYYYAWSPGGEATEDIAGLTAGSYSVLVTDSNGCTATASYQVVEPPALTATASGTLPYSHQEEQGPITIAGTPPPHKPMPRPQGLLQVVILLLFRMPMGVILQLL